MPTASGKAAGRPAITPGILANDRVLVERLCTFARSRYPALASHAAWRSLSFLHSTGQVWHDCAARTWHTDGEGTPSFVGPCLRGAPPCRPPIGGVAVQMEGRGGERPCHVMVLVHDLKTGQPRPAAELRSTITHENLHCALHQHLAPADRARFLDWIAATFPYEHLRGWFDNPLTERYYRTRTGISPSSLLLGGYIDTSPYPNVSSSRREVLHYLKEAFAARVDDALAGNPSPRPRHRTEHALLVFAKRLNAVAHGGAEPVQLPLRFK